MASNRIDEILKNLPSQKQAAFKEATQALKDHNAQLREGNNIPQAAPSKAQQISAPVAGMKEIEQTMKANNVQLKENNYGPQTPPPKAQQIRTSEPNISEPVANHLESHQRGAQKIQQAQVQAQQPKAPEPTQTQQKGQQLER